MSSSITGYQDIYSDRVIVVRPWSCTLIATFILLFVLAFKVWVHMHSTDIGYRLGEARALHNDLDMQRRDLELQKSVLLRPHDLAQAANQRLAMYPLSGDRIKRIK
jgi:hypothetical protein